MNPMNPAGRLEVFRALAPPARSSVLSVVPADRSFKVLQPSRVPAQMSLFPPPGLLARHGR